MKAALPFWTAIALTALLWAPGASAQRVIYVDTDAAGANDGSSWANAFVFLQDALAVAQDGDEVWVAEGVYRPDQGVGVELGDRNATFRITTGISIYGGFQGLESTRLGTGWKTHATILSGDLLDDDSGPVSTNEPTRQDNSCHVMQIDEASGPVRVEGVFIEGGNTNDVCPAPRGGGGMWITINRTPLVFLRRVSIRRNAAIGAGGVWVTGDLPPDGIVIDAAEFVENYSESGGGGLKASWVRLDIRNSVFRENQGGGSLNGALYTWGSQVRVLDVRFTGNFNVGLVTEASILTLVGGHFFGNTGIWGPAQQVTKGGRALIVNSVYSGNKGSFGSAIYMEQDTPVDLVNSTISHNTATSDSSSIFCWNCSIRVLNSILWSVDGHPPQIGGSLTQGVAIGHSIIAGGLPVGTVDLGGNLEGDPVFADPVGADGRIGTEDDNLSVGPGSPAVDGGDSSAIPPDSLDVDEDGDLVEALPRDIFGSPRVQGNSVDIGAFESVRHTNREPGNSPRPALLEIDPPFPNPFTSFASLRVFSRSAFVEAVVLRVFDSTGRTVSSPRQVALPPGMVMLFQIGDASWPAGTYLIVIDHVSGRYTRRLTHLR